MPSKGVRCNIPALSLTWVLDFPDQQGQPSVCCHPLIAANLHGGAVLCNGVHQGPLAAVLSLDGYLQDAEGKQREKAERLRFGRFFYRFPNGESG